jgi:hypothetical protein
VKAAAGQISLDDGAQIQGGSDDDASVLREGLSDQGMQEIRAQHRDDSGTGWAQSKTPTMGSAFAIR